MKTLLILLFVILSTYNSYAETRIKIVVIDSGISKVYKNRPYLCKDGIKTVLNDDGFDEVGHGTNVIGLIVKNMNIKKYCIVSIKTWSRKLTFSQIRRATIDSVMMASNYKTPYINISMAGGLNSIAELDFIKKIIDSGTTISVAAGNDGRKLDKLTCFTFPACYKYDLTPKQQKKFIVISSNTTEYPNTGDVVDYYLDGKDKGFPKMSGTSQATAIFTSRLLSK